MRKNHKMSIISLVSLGLLTSFSSTLAFWQGSVSFDDKTQGVIIGIGNWDQGGSSGPAENVPEYNEDFNGDGGDYVYHDGDYYVIRYDTGAIPEDNQPYGPYNLISYNWIPSNTYKADNVVYYEGSFYRALNGGGNVTDVCPDQSQPIGWYNMNDIHFTTSQAFYQGDFAIFNSELYYTISDNVWNNVQYPPSGAGNRYWRKVGSFEFSTSIVYQYNDVVLYNGIYYRNNSHAVTTWNAPSGTPWDNWQPANFATYVPGTTYSEGDIVLYNGHPYKVYDSSLTATYAPETYPGVYKRLDTAEYLPNNAYDVGDVVFYNGQYYRVVNKQRAENYAPGLVKDSWNLLNSAQYNPLNTYFAGDYVMYNGKAYYVYNEVNANLYAPATHANAWNIHGTLEYDPYTVYSTTYYVGDKLTQTIVIYHNIAYIALQESVNQLPPSRPATSNAYWAEYVAG